MAFPWRHPCSASAKLEPMLSLFPNREHMLPVCLSLAQRPCEEPWSRGAGLSHGAGVQGSALHGGSSDPAILAAKGRDSCLPIHRPLFAWSPGTLHQAGVLAKDLPSSSLWVLVEGAPWPQGPSSPWCSSTGHAGTGRELGDGGGEVPAAQMTAGLSLCLPARVKLDSWEASEP